MAVLFWVRVTEIVAGGGLAAYGCYVLTTGRLSRRARAAFRSTRDAGMYPLCSGAGLVALAVAQFSSDAESLSLAYTLGATIVALLLMGVAFVRYRPRGPGSRP
jgi:drug/metabolite transporter (DMT)-like permease